jgi:uncharacterized C2H2 Zn-finger protein
MMSGYYQLREVTDRVGTVICFKCPVCGVDFQLSEEDLGRRHVDEMHAKRLDEG